MITYHNVYRFTNSDGNEELVVCGRLQCYSEDAKLQNHSGQDQRDWVRLEMHFNGHWFRPPVGLSIK